MRTVDIIIKKKQGLPLTNEEIHFVIDGYVHDQIPDYQISALLMAICFNGLNHEEQVALTKEMLESGEQIDLSSIKGICVDKHSTGGVGDKTTLVVGPVLASCGLKLAKMSGRGLGHTGGTLDKLESIPGFKINIDSEDFYKQVREISLAVIGQTKNITPADKKLYALRDVTGTVDSVGLIASSIMSKKLASGAHSIILDVKVGEGAFMKTIEDAKVLANAMVSIGRSYGRDMVAVLSNMNEPLGNMVGNSLEVIEAIETLKGRGPKSFRDFCLELVAELLVETKVSKTKEEALLLASSKIDNGEALEKLKQMIIYQHGDARVIEDYSLFPQAKNKIAVVSNEDGYVKNLDALEIGLSAMLLGAGRENKNDNIDLAVGIEVCKKVGDEVKKGETLAYLYSNGKNEKEAYDKVFNAYEFSKDFVNEAQIIYGVVR
ncbi:MAG: pyrimidine-nucleoside phosphorylase [Bacilli bacterium]|nr:pyrimidine-nucleoside phosphorylase [Acholeplasmataceae bacterium]MDY2901880.1 pyrimidine-nucleoside phosphorylase [Bacilli bacterium]